MQTPWIQAGGFENVLPFVILILWVIGKVMNARAGARAKRPPGPPPPVRQGGAPEASPAESGEEQLRRFLAELTGTEPPPAAPPPAPEPLSVPPALPEFRPAEPARPPMASSLPGPSASPEPFSLRRSVAERHRRRRMRPAAPPPVPPAIPEPVRRPAAEAPVAPGEAVTVLGPQARRSVMPASGLQGITMGGPHLGTIASAASA